MNDRESQSGAVMNPAVGLVPLPSDFVKFPAGWYLFGSVQELSGAPVCRRMLGRELVGFRTESGRFAVLDNRCAHLGATLSGGCVVGETIECPYHGWKYDTSGTCVEVPGASRIPEFARQRAFPVSKRFGYVFFFNGSKAPYELPFFDGERPEDYVGGRLFEFAADSPWYMLGAHAFDRRHLERVHLRKLQGDLHVEDRGPYGRQAWHESEVCGDNVFDRLIRPLFGSRVRISMTVYGGSTILVTGDFKRARSRFYLMPTPQEDGTCRVKGLVLKPKGSALVDALTSKLSLELRRWFTQGYLVDEARSLGSHTFRPHALCEQDALLADYLRWVCKASRPAEIEAH